MDTFIGLPLGSLPEYLPWDSLVSGRQMHPIMDCQAKRWSNILVCSVAPVSAFSVPCPRKPFSPGKTRMLEHPSQECPVPLHESDINSNCWLLVLCSFEALDKINDNHTLIHPHKWFPSLIAEGRKYSLRLFWKSGGINPPSAWIRIFTWSSPKQLLILPLPFPRELSVSWAHWNRFLPMALGRIWCWPRGLNRCWVWASQKDTCSSPMLVMSVYNRLWYIWWARK